MHERHVVKGHNGNQSTSNQNGVRQRVPALQCIRGDTTPTSASLMIRDTISPGHIPAPPLSQGAPRAAQTRAKLLDALAHPAQAAAAAAAAAAGSHQPPRGGRKRKTISLVVLTLMCGAVVYYSGTMYDYDDYFADAKTARRPRLRPAGGMDYQLSTFSKIVIPTSAKQHHQQHEANMSPRHAMIRDRIVHALKAAFVADAASMGTHWIYNTNELEVQLQSKEQPEFRSPPVPKFYSAQEFPGHYGPGQPSPYGEQLLFVTQYAATMATSAGTRRVVEEFDDDDDDDNLVPDSILEPMSAALQKWATTFGGRADHAALQFLSCRRQRVQDYGQLQQAALPPKPQNDDDGDSGEDELKTSCGADDDQAHFFLKVIPTTCLYVGHAHRRHYVEQAIRVHQNNDNAVLLGLALSDLLERVLLMDETANDSAGTSSNDNGSSSSIPPMPESQAKQPKPSGGGGGPKPVASLREALDTTLTLLQEEHSEGWFHFADSFTVRHQQQEALLDSWIKAKKTAEKKKSIAQVAASSGSTCHMPGALIVSLHALYRAANAEAKTTPNKAKRKATSAVTHHNMAYDYLVKTLLGVSSSSTSTGAAAEPREENPLLVAAVRGNILAAGDTCSRAILMGAVLGAAYGGPPTAWWEKLYPVLSGQVEEAAYTIADFAVKRLMQQEQKRH